MSISVLGPTFGDLAVNVRKNISDISYIFIGRSAGYIGGSLLGSVLFEYMNPHLLLGGFSSLFSITTGTFSVLQQEDIKRLQTGADSAQLYIFLFKRRNKNVHSVQYRINPV